MISSLCRFNPTWGHRRKTSDFSFFFFSVFVLMVTFTGAGSDCPPCLQSHVRFRNNPPSRARDQASSSPKRDGGKGRRGTYPRVMARCTLAKHLSGEERPREPLQWSKQRQHSIGASPDLPSLQVCLKPVGHAAIPARKRFPGAAKAGDVCSSPSATADADCACSPISTTLPLASP